MYEKFNLIDLPITCSYSLLPIAVIITLILLSDRYQHLTGSLLYPTFYVVIETLFIIISIINCTFVMYVILQHCQQHVI